MNSLLTTLLLLQAGIAVNPEADGYRVATEGYEAVISADGSLTSLKIAGAEFLKTRGGNPRGIYVYRDGPLTLPDITQPEADSVLARNDDTEVRYSFARNSVTWTATNRGTGNLICLIVLDPAVAAVKVGEGVFEKTPTQATAATTTWFRDDTCLTITGGNRVWGPWSDGLQVWQTDVPPGSSNTVVLTVGETSPEDGEGVRAALAYVAEPPTDPVGPMWDLEALTAAPAARPAEGFAEDGVRAVFYDTLPYKGRATETFAWVGVPDVAPGAKVPGMVLIHGGGGTAFADWVRMWNRRGYAAIAMDTCGCLAGGEHSNRPRNPRGGPPGWGGHGQIDWPRTDQWTYHAVADVVLAHSLLRSLPEVDPERTGVTGISWGGYLCCIVAGVDTRFKLAAPVYGCGFTTEHALGGSVTALGEERAARWMRWWDPSVYLPDAPMPMLWVTGTNDFAFTFNALQKSYRLPKGPRTLCIRVRMPHGQEQGANPEEIRGFADSILMDGKPLPRFDEAVLEDNRVRASFTSEVPVAKAELVFTRDTGKWQDRLWESVAAELDPNGRVTATLPDGVTVWYLNLTDERGYLVSTEHAERMP